MEPNPARTVSVVLVNYRGVDDTLTAIQHLESSEWPRESLEIVVVDNASGDDSVKRLRELGSQIVLIESRKNLGFAGGCNLGVRRSRGEVIGFLNNDARPDAQWIAAGVRALGGLGRVGAVASKVLDWDGRAVDYVDAALTWYGMGYKPHTGDPVPAGYDYARSVLFPTGSGMFVDRSVFDEVGGFDDRYFMFFEDVDLGWRINLAGYAVRFAPDSIVYHKHHASMKGSPEFRERFLLERNALYTLFKNADDAMLEATLAPALALAVHRGVSRGGLDSSELDLRNRDDDSLTREVSKETLAPIYAIENFVSELPQLRRDRDRIQGARKVSPRKIATLMRETDVPASQSRRYLHGYSNIVEAFAVAGKTEARKVVVITGDPLGSLMAGPAIRATAMARLLSLDHDVTLVSLTAVRRGFDAPCEAVTIRPGDDRAMRRLIADAEIVIFQGLALAIFPSLNSFKGKLVVDAYDPMHFEQLEQAKHKGDAEWSRAVSSATEVLNGQLSRADFVVCASDRQRMMYLGQLAALGRVVPGQYERDADLRGLIDVAPFGLEATLPKQDRHGIRGAVPGIGADDKVVIWSGGLYDWFDPQSLIRAIGQLAERRPNIRLFFQGTAHPNPDVPPMPILEESRALARSLGVLDTHVFFNASWVPYADRHNFLLDADVAVSTHRQHVETTFSFRTRVLDYLWAGLPMVLTGGDTFADLTEREGLGRVVEAEDVDALATAIEDLAYNSKSHAAAAKNIARVREDYTWERTLAPVLAFVDEPSFAPDRVLDSEHRARRRERRPVRKTGLRRTLSGAWSVLRKQGPVAFAKKTYTRITRPRG